MLIFDASPTLARRRTAALGKTRSRPEAGVSQWDWCSGAQPVRVRCPADSEWCLVPRGGDLRDPSRVHPMFAAARCRQQLRTTLDLSGSPLIPVWWHSGFVRRL
jgi:hypothetical protein